MFIIIIVIMIINFIVLFFIKLLFPNYIYIFNFIFEMFDNNRTLWFY